MKSHKQSRVLFTRAAGGLALWLVFLTVLVLCCALVPATTPPGFAATWSSEIQVNVDDNNDDWSPKLAIDATGRVWFVWKGVDSIQLDEEVYYRYWENGSWGPQATVNPPNGLADRFPELCTGKRDGVPWCVWAGWNSATTAYDVLVSRWDGDSWSWPETVFVGGGRYDDYDIVARDTSLVWVLWSTRTRVPPTHKDIFARARVDGVWGQVEEIVMPQGHEGQVRADLDNGDRLWAVWQSDSLDEVVVQSCVRDESGWGEVVHVAMDSAGSVVPWVAVDDSGVAWTVWTRGDTGYSGSHIMSARWEEGGWRHLGRVNSVGGNGVGNGNPVIRNVPGSGPLVVWWGGPYSVGDEKDVYESKWTAYGWREQACVSTPDSVYLAPDEYPSLAVGSDGHAWVCWMKGQRYSPYDYDIFRRHSSDVTPVYDLSGLRAEARDGVVVLGWIVDYLSRFRVYRSGPLAGRTSSEEGLLIVGCESVGSVLPDETECLTPEPIVRSGTVEYTDSSAEPGSGYQYWVLEERGRECYVHGPLYVEVEGLRAGWIESVFPNPFVSDGWISWSGGGGSAVEVLDLSGRLVRRLFESNSMSFSLGQRISYWDGRDDEGKLVASGVYLVRLTLGDKPVGRAVRKVVILR